MHYQYASDPSSEYDDTLADKFLEQEDEAILLNEMAYEIFLATGIDNS